jgi:uncharacterized membrane protein
MPTWINALRARPTLLLAIALGAALAVTLPRELRPVTRALCAWDAGVWAYLASTVLLMSRADHHTLRRRALLHAEGLAAVTTVAACAVAAILGAIFVELSQAKASMAHGGTWWHVAFALSTIVGSWLLMPTLFAVAYASLYYAGTAHAGGGLIFPCDAGRDEPPDYGDFLYFSLTLAATSQTSDVQVSRRVLRRWVTVQAVLSFAFNTMLLALAINIAAGLI